MSKSNISCLSIHENNYQKYPNQKFSKLMHTPNFFNMDSYVPATSLLHTVSAAYKNIPYTDEAASET
jgi:hypothetical protein